MWCFNKLATITAYISFTSVSRVFLTSVTDVCSAGCVTPFSLFINQQGSSWRTGSSAQIQWVTCILAMIFFKSWLEILNVCLHAVWLPPGITSIIIKPLPVLDWFTLYWRKHSKWSSNIYFKLPLSILFFLIFPMFFLYHKLQIFYYLLFSLFHFYRNECSSCSGWWTCAYLASSVPGLASQWHTASPHADSQRAAGLPQEYYQHQAWQESIHRGWWHEGPLQLIHCE